MAFSTFSAKNFIQKLSIPEFVNCIVFQTLKSLDRFLKMEKNNEHLEEFLKLVFSASEVSIFSGESVATTVSEKLSMINEKAKSFGFSEKPNAPVFAFVQFFVSALSENPDVQKEIGKVFCETFFSPERIETEQEQEKPSEGTEQTPEQTEKSKKDLIFEKIDSDLQRLLKQKISKVSMFNPKSQQRVGIPIKTLACSVCRSTLSSFN